MSDRALAIVAIAFMAAAIAELFAFVRRERRSPYAWLENGKLRTDLPEPTGWIKPEEELTTNTFINFDMAWNPEWDWPRKD